MRIIGGKNRSRIINEVGIPTTKPTADNVREAVFNSLYDVNGAVVLDLFAGSGSYGLEALSRGAKSSHFNDNHPKAIATIKENINLLGEKENCFVTPYEYNQALFHIRNKDLKYDLVFLDPPYEFESDDYNYIIFGLRDNLNEGAKIVLELHKNQEFELTNNFKIIKDQIYGIKRIIILKKI